MNLSQEAREVHDASLLVDLHCDVLLTRYFLGWDLNKRHRGNPLPGAALMGHCDIPRLKEGNFGCLALGIVTNPLRRASGPSAISSDLDRLHGLLADSPDTLALATTAAEIRAARAAGKIAVFAGLEGAHGLYGRLDELPAFQARGLAYVGLVHFSKNEACRPMVGWGQDHTVGLSPFGRDLVAELNHRAILIDVAHVNRAGLLETCAATDKPLICSHTSANAVYSSPRGLDDDQLRAVARTGGVVGVIFVTPFIGPGGVDAVAAHLHHIKDKVGVEHCAIGTDWEGWSLYPSDLDSAEKMPRLTEALLRLKWRPEEILACYGENFLRVIAASRG